MYPELHPNALSTAEMYQIKQEVTEELQLNMVVQDEVQVDEEDRREDEMRKQNWGQTLRTCHRR